MANGKPDQQTERADIPRKPRMTLREKIEPMETERPFVQWRSKR